MEAELEAPLRAAVSFLDKKGYRYAIIGGLALSQWGVIRVTRDVDIKVLVPHVDYTEVRNEIIAAFPKQEHPEAPKNPLIITVSISGVIVDFLLALPGYEELIIERAVLRDLDGWQAWICSAEDLIIQKVVASRGKDWLDVESLLIEQHGKLDETYIIDWLEQFSEALEKPEILSEYYDLQRKISGLFGESSV